MIFSNLIQTNLRTQTFGKQIEYYNRLESTNEEAWELIDETAVHHGALVITDHQFAGKGRGKNSWFMSPSKGLAMSLILLESITAEKAGLIPLAAGAAAAKAMENRGSSPKLKWPNDILINEKKVGGILCESRLAGQQVRAIVVGIGLNINETEMDFPDELKESATSLNLMTGHVHQRELVAAIVITFFEQYWGKLQQVPQEIIRDWTQYCGHLNQPISFKDRGNTHTGIFKNVDENGYACIEIAGEDQVFHSVILN
jgi:BirA family biotin operon repressor/biotin-[acetyl-CoA-carboxylase] ligase